MKKIVLDIYNIIKSNFKSIFIFEIIYRIVSLTVLVRIFEIAVGYILKGSGNSYLNPKNIGTIFTNPLTYPVLIGMILILILVGAYEMAVLYEGFSAAATGSNTRITAMTFGGLKRFARMFYGKNLPVVALNALLLYGIQMINIYELSELSRRGSDIMKVIAGTKALRFMCVIIVAAAVAGIVITMFALCYQTYGDNTGKQSEEPSIYQKGRKFYQKRIFRLVCIFFAEMVTLTALFFLAYFICMVVVACFVVVFTPDKYEMILVDVLGRNIKMLLVFFNSVIASLVCVGSITGIFFHYEHEIKAEIPVNPGYKAAPWKKKMFKITGIVILVGTVVSIFDVVVNGNRTIDNIFGNVAITAHRGNSGEAPENTIPAMEKAIDSFADYAEIDVRETSDGEIVVMHDLSVYRTTGVRNNVSDMTLDEIEKLDAGSFYSREYAGTGVPTLREVLKECKGKINLIIEIKTNRKDSDDYIHNIIEMIKDMKMEEQCMFQSGTYSVLKEIKKEDLDLHTGYIVAAAYGDYFKDDNVDFFSINASYINQNNVDAAHGYGKAVLAWTVNNRLDMIRMKNYGVDGIITDYPALAREVIYENDDTQSLVSYIRMLMK